MRHAGDIRNCESALRMLRSRGHHVHVAFRGTSRIVQLDPIGWFRLPPPNHIKLDVDGGELGVLEGAPRTLSSPALRSILVEVPTAQSGEIAGLLERHGLRLDSKIVLKTKAGEYAMWYGAFVRDGTRQRVAQ